MQLLAIFQIICLALTMVQALPGGSNSLKVTNIKGSHGGRSNLTVTNEMVADFKLYSQYATAAYCGRNVDKIKKGEMLSCAGKRPDYCPLVEAEHAEIIAAMQNDIFTDATGFVAKVPSQKKLVLTFRGTKSPRSLAVDLLGWKQLFRLCDDCIQYCNQCVVHTGFLKSWIATDEKLMKPFKEFMQAHPDWHGVVTGHSLGGAIAVLAAANLRAENFPVALYTYGQPRVGNNNFSTWVTNNPGNGNYRITLLDDPIPRMGPLNFGYDHISPEYHIETLKPDPSPEDIKVYEGPINLDGNAGTKGKHFNVHGHYFGKLMCGTVDIF